MSGEYRNNHYVPIWYQKKFLLPENKDKELYYLELMPRPLIDQRGVVHSRSGIHRWGPRKCFMEKDLYLTKIGFKVTTKIEELFFGQIDVNGKRGAEYFAEFVHPSADREAFQGLIRYMSAQKLRTPKGLGWLKTYAKSVDQQLIVKLMVESYQLYCAIWTECVWLIADASQSPTKFIITDHPVTVYNRRCGPRSDKCRDINDPDIRYHGSHTMFPLSSDKILILSNLSWVRNPYQSEIGLRPNPNLLRDAIFNFTQIQTNRHLNEQEVREINFILKSRAYRFIAAAKQEWLFPEHYVSKSNWHQYGHGYLLMPDPRSVAYGGPMIIGYKDGSTSVYDEYGRRPWAEGYTWRNDNIEKDFNTFLRFKGEYARLYGPRRKGRAFNAAHFDDECDNEEMHKYHLNLEKKRR